MSESALRRLESVCRYFIALLMLLYGLVKVFQGQFYTDAHWKDTPLGALTGMQLAWSFYSHAPMYETIIGLVEVFVGALFLFRRTTDLGVVLFLPIIVNLLALNVFFRIGALGSAVPLFLAGLIVFATSFRRLKAFFWDSRRDHDSRVGPGAKLVPFAVLAIAGTLAGVVVFNNKLRFRQDDRLKGGWAIQAGSPTLRRIYFEKGRTCVVRDASDALHFTDYASDGAGHVRIAGNDAVRGLEDARYRFDGASLLLEAPGATWRLSRLPQ